MATVTLGAKYHIPSIEQWVELYKYCTLEWTYINDWGGYLLKSKVNDNSIFLPVTGVMREEIDRPGKDGSGDYWSSTLGTIRPGSAHNSNEHISFTNNSIAREMADLDWDWNDYIFDLGNRSDHTIAWDLDFDWGGFYLDDSSSNYRSDGKAIRACTK